jgi:hypothetical protein
MAVYATLTGVALLAMACTQSTIAKSTPPAVGRPVVDLSATPPGWLPVDLGNAQISVPPSWGLVTDGNSGCGTEIGAVVLGDGRWCPLGLVSPTPSEASIAYLHTVSSPMVTSEGPRSMINGIPTYTPSVAPVIDIPALQATLSFEGSPPPQVLNSLTFSPRSVVLSGARSPSVPRSWRQLSFAGLRFAVPASWKVTYPAYAFTCGSNVVLPEPGVTLAYGPPLPGSCPPGESEVRPVPQVPGVEVDDFPIPGESDSGSSCTGPTRIGSLHLCIEKTPAYGVLVAQVRSANRPPVTIRIGLTTSGATAKTILYSLRSTN